MIEICVNEICVSKRMQICNFERHLRPSFEVPLTKGRSVQKDLPVIPKLFTEVAEGEHILPRRTTWLMALGFSKF